MSDRVMSDDELAPVYAALGRVVYTASSVEFAVEFTGQQLAGADKAKADKLKGKTINALADLVKKYARSPSYLTPTMLAALNLIVADVLDGMGRRNAYVHGYWGEPDGVLSAMNSKAYDKEPTGFRIKPLSVEHLDQLAEDLTALRERMLLWAVRALVLEDPDLPSRIPGWEPDTAPPYPPVPTP